MMTHHKSDLDVAQLKIKHTSSVVLSTTRPLTSSLRPKESHWLSDFGLEESSRKAVLSLNQRKSSRKLSFRKNARRRNVAERLQSTPPLEVRESCRAAEQPASMFCPKTAPNFPTLSTAAALTRGQIRSVSVDELAGAGRTASLTARLKNTGIVTSFSTNLGKGQRSASSGRISTRLVKTPEQKRQEIEKRWPMAQSSRELFGPVLEGVFTSEDRVPRYVPAHGVKDYKSCGCNAVSSFLGLAK